MTLNRGKDVTGFDSLKAVQGFLFCVIEVSSKKTTDALASWYFTGSGTTAKVALMSKRQFVGFEISKEYCDIANERIKELMNLSSLSLFEV